MPPRLPKPGRMSGIVCKSGRQDAASGALATRIGSAPVTACRLSTTRSRIRRPPTARRPLGTPPYRLAAPPASTTPRMLGLEVAMFDGEATVHDKRDPGLGRARLGGYIDDSLLEPDQLRGGPQPNRLVHDGARVLTASKDIYDVDRVLACRVAECRVAFFAQDHSMPGIHRHDRVARALQVVGDRIAGPHRVGRQSHDRDRVGPVQQAAEFFFFGRCHASRLCTCGVPLTARPTSTIPERAAIVTARVEGTLGVATHASPARAALNASSAEIRPVTSSPCPVIGVRASTAAPITLSTALCLPMSSA